MRLSMRHRIGLGAEISIKSPKIFKLGFQALSSDPAYTGSLKF